MEYSKDNYVAPVRTFFQPKSIGIFLISLQKHNYVVGTCTNSKCHAESLLMSTHNRCFHGKENYLPDTHSGVQI